MASCGTTCRKPKRRSRFSAFWMASTATGKLTCWSVLKDGDITLDEASHDIGSYKSTSSCDPKLHTESHTLAATAATHYSTVPTQPSPFGGGISSSRRRERANHGQNQAHHIECDAALPPEAPLEKVESEDETLVTVFPLRLLTPSTKWTARHAKTHKNRALAPKPRCRRWPWRPMVPRRKSVLEFLKKHYLYN